MKHAFKREYLDKDLRTALMELKINTGVHENYNAMVRSVTDKHPTEIKSHTLRGWLKQWCEKNKPIPHYYSPHDVTKSRKADFPRGKKPDPEFSIFQDEPTEPRKEDIAKPPIALSIGKTSEIMIDNGTQALIIKSIGGYLTIEQL